MLVRSCSLKSQSTSIGCFEDVHTDIQNTLVASYNSIRTVYDSPSFHKRHDDRPNSSDYARQHRTNTTDTRSRWRAEMESSSPHLHSSACRNKEADKQKNTDAMAESHSSRRPGSWLGWVDICDWFWWVYVSSCHSESREMTSSRAKSVFDQVGASQQFVAGGGFCWDGAWLDWSWVEGVTHARHNCGRLDKWRLRGTRCSCKSYPVVYVFLEMIYVTRMNLQLTWWCNFVCCPKKITHCIHITERYVNCNDFFNI